MNKVLVFIIFVSTVLSGSAYAQNDHGCDFKGTDNGGWVDVKPRMARLVARLADPPRTKVRLSINDTYGNHNELVWDPAINDGLQHSILLPGDRRWILSPSSDEDRIQTGQIILVISTKFTGKENDPDHPRGLMLSGSREAMAASAGAIRKDKAPGAPRIYLTCEDGQVQMSSLKLDSRRVAAAAAARGLLDQPVPTPVTEALSIIAEIAVERAKSGAMRLVKDKFVGPLCGELTLDKLGLRDETRVLPRTCSLLEHLRLDDVLSSGKSLIAAIKDDVRSTIVPILLKAVIANNETRELARIALQFANRMIDGESSSIIDIDFLVSLLDRLPWSSGFEQSHEIVFGWLATLELDEASLEALVIDALDRALPEEFWNNVQSPLAKLNVAECKPEYPKLKRLAGYIVPPIRGECLRQVTRELIKERSGLDAIKLSLSGGYFKMEHLALALSFHVSKPLSAYLESRLQGADDKTRTDVLSTLLPKSGRPALANTCAVRLVVGIAKWCSGREACSAGEVADVLANPRRLFNPTMKLPESLCWNGQDYLLPEESVQKFLDLGVRLVAFLNPPAKGDERTRALAMVRWLFAVVRAINSRSQLDRSGQIEQVEQIVGHLIEADYMRAIAAAFTLAKETCRVCGELPETKALGLIGAVTSYMQTYEDTKGLGAEAARKARKQAIESLMDAATDRTERGGHRIFSIGSNVGLSMTWTDRYGQRSDDDILDPGLRVPLGLGVDWLPGEDRWYGRHIGFHVGVQLADLGQFVRRGSDRKLDNVQWADFVAPGIEISFLLGFLDPALNLSFHGSYAPSLRFEEATGPTNTDGVWRYGISLGYYVPFFDLD